MWNLSGCLLLKKIANLKDSAYFEMRYLVWTAMQLCNLMPYSCPNTSAAGAPRGPGPAPRRAKRAGPPTLAGSGRPDGGNPGIGGGRGEPRLRPPGTSRKSRPHPRGQAGQTRRTEPRETQRTATTPAGKAHGT